MNTNIKVIRVFSKSDEHEELKYSIIAYMKRPYTSKDVDMGNGQGKTIIDSWKYYLRINLWLITINFTWIK